tara:strand:- start:5607 stop:7388 length:1782 start_codon:yes stop_codon:yes gene_type:complete
MRVSDRVAELLAEFGIKHVFMVTGGGAMHLNDAFGRNQSLKVINMHHEQTCSMAADGYARTNNLMACVNVTTGPGGINAINGVFGAWTDSVPMVIISGQVKRETLNFKNSKLRQLGDQENNIVSMVKNITKFSYILKNPHFVDDVVSKALKIATTGRPGPVWIDIPIDIQGAPYEKSKQLNLNRLSVPVVKKINKETINKVKKLIQNSKRPAILVGGGIRASGAHKEFLKFINKTDIPVLTAWNAHDVLHDSHKNYAGRPGTVGNRAGNFIIENCDLLIVLGSRLNIRQIGYNFNEFSKNSFKVMVDVDKEELNKKTLDINLKINHDLNDFLKAMNDSFNKLSIVDHKKYLSWCKELNLSFPIFKQDYKNSKKVNPYYFVNELFKNLKEKDNIVTSDGTAVVTTFQGAILKKDQRLFSNSGSASMGFGLPAAIGTCFAADLKETYCIEGDGSIQMNIQDLATISKYKLPIKIFILSNDGYHSIRQTQNKYFPDNTVGCGPESGLEFPDFKLIANGYGLKYKQINTSNKLPEIIKEVIQEKEPIVCEVVIDKNQEFEPKASSKLYPDGRMKSAPLYDLYPFLDSKIIDEIINYE